MEVRITKCSNESLWYSNRVGKIITVRLATKEDLISCEMASRDPADYYYAEESKNNIPGIIRKTDCEIIQEATVKEYEAAQDILGIKGKQITVVISDSQIANFVIDSFGTMVLSKSYIGRAIREGIIREKKSANEELAGRIVTALDRDYTPIDKDRDYICNVILSELEKAGVNSFVARFKADPYNVPENRK